MLEETGSPVPASAGDSRKRLGAWYTPDDLVARVVVATITPAYLAGRADRPLRILDPACGDGRFLRAAAARVESSGARCELSGVDVDRGAVAAARRELPRARIERDDALTRAWGDERFDVVIGNPPFLSQMAAATSRGGASELGGGPYADAAAEFLALAARLVEPVGGRVALVLPQSILAARDAAEVRARYDERAEMIWSWWSDERVFDAQVYACALAFEFGPGSTERRAPWSHVVTSRRNIPQLDELVAAARGAPDAGTLGDRARLNANFRDEYYGMIPAVGDHADGPPLITSGLIDPGVCRWGERPVTFARRRFAAPRIDVAALDPKMVKWAEQRLVPKVLVANQTRIIEAVCDPTGAWLPAVPVVAAYPRSGGAARAWEVAAVLTSPVASAWAWHRSAGTGLSANTIRLGPVMLADLPWPRGPLTRAVAALRNGEVLGCAAAVVEAYGLDGRTDLLAWWEATPTRRSAR